MNIINSTVLRNNLSDTIDEISKKKDYLLISRRGKIDAAIVDIELFEDLMALVNKNYVKSIKKARKEYEQGDTYTHTETFGEI